MRKFLITISAFAVLVILTASCNTYTCPAYASDVTPQEQSDNANS